MASKKKVKEAEAGVLTNENMKEAVETVEIAAIVAETKTPAPKAPKPNCVCANCRSIQAVKPGQVIR